MTDEIEIPETGAGAGSAGERLRAARQAAGLELEQVAAQTRIPQRHLVSIEAGDFAALPSRTYAVGFSRTYARAVGLDEQAIIAHVRDELAQGQGEARGAPARFEPGDPARVPNRGLAWFALLATVLLVGGIYAFYQSYFAPGIDPAPLTEKKPAAAKPKPAAGVPSQPLAAGPVVFTNELDGTWVRFYDAKGARLFEGVMAKGESFTVPATADNPQIRTGRPYAFAITVGGTPVAKLSDKDEIVSDVPISAQALMARTTAAAGTATPPAVPAPSAAPTAGLPASTPAT